MHGQQLVVDQRMMAGKARFLMVLTMDSGPSGRGRSPSEQRSSQKGGKRGYKGRLGKVRSRQFMCSSTPSAIPSK